jgi:crossover junction endodeoxyribonuclease RuvC
MQYRLYPFDKIILGVDPGTNILGYAVIGTKADEFELIDMHHFNFKRLESHFEKLKNIAEHLSILIDKYKPSEMAIEAPFQGKNIQSMLKLGRAQGVAMTIGLTKGLQITEYSPKSIKKAITGNGNASKEQMAGLLTHLCKENFSTTNLDATDALAAAICHHYQRNHRVKNKKYNGWGEFLKDNPDRFAEK